MMPQKKNPDSLELIRGKTGRVYGDLMTLLTIQKGLPLTYGKDLQEDKEPLFDALDTARDCALVFTGVIETMKVRRNRMREALDANLYATDLADALVRRGVPFREAHHIVGGLVGTAVARGMGITELPWDEFEKASTHFRKEDIARLTPESSTDARSVSGGTARQSVIDQLSRSRWLRNRKEMTVRLARSMMRGIHAGTVYDTPSYCRVSIDLEHLRDFIVLERTATSLGAPRSMCSGSISPRSAQLPFTPTTPVADTAAASSKLR